MITLMAACFMILEGITLYYLFIKHTNEQKRNEYIKGYHDGWSDACDSSYTFFEKYKEANNK